MARVDSRARLPSQPISANFCPSRFRPLAGLAHRIDGPVPMPAAVAVVFGAGARLGGGEAVVKRRKRGLCSKWWVLLFSGCDARIKGQC